jgi:glucose-6-phosphate isomerase
VRYLPGESNVGGRFSALSTFGLLPATLLGVDCTILLDDAADIRERLQESDSENPAIQLAEMILAQQPFLALPDQSLSYWVEQLIAESTGKEGRGIIPIITSPSEVDELVHQVNALPLGAAFYLWEWTVALLGYALEVNPFDQPDVARAKSATSRALHSGGASTNPVAQTTQSALALIDQKFAFTGGYIGILAFVPMRDKSIRQLMYEIRQGLHDRYRLSEKKVTLGFGPRYLHSTGQCHKGGPAFGAFLIITLDDDLTSDFPIPNEEFTFGQLLRAQASGDYEVLADIGRPVVHAHLTREELVKFSQSLHVTS